MTRQKLLVIVCACWISFTASGQMVAIPVTNTIRTPYGNATYTTYQYMRMPMAGQENISAKYEFKVVLQNDSTFLVKSRINLPKKEKENQSLTVKSKGEKSNIFPADTKSISRITLEGQKLEGIPADSCWLFKSVSGKINGYSFLAEPGMTYVIAIQDGEDSPIVPLTKASLQDMINTENSKIHKLLEKGKLLKAIALYNSESE